MKEIPTPTKCLPLLLRVASVAGFTAVVLISTDRATERLLLGSGGLLVLTTAAIGLIQNNVFKNPPLLAGIVCGAIFSILQGISLAGTAGELGLVSFAGLAVAAVLIQASLTFQQIPFSLHRKYQRWIAATMVTLVAYFLCEAAATLWSPHQVVALKTFIRELCVYVGGFFIAMRLALSRSWLFRQVSSGAGAAVMFICCLMLAVGGMYALRLLPPSLVGEESWIRVGISNGEWRLQFPFQHHNRAGFFGMCATFIIPSFWVAFRPFSWRAAALLAFVGISVTVLSVTRGAQLGILAGGITVLAATKGLKTRPALLLAAGILMAFLVGLYLLPSQRSHWIEDLSGSSSLAGRQTSAGNRLVIQSVTLELIEKRHLEGYGYGSPVFEKVTQQVFPAIAANVEGMSHPHNFWLEKAFAAGMPGALCFFAFTFCRLATLASVISRVRSRGEVRLLGPISLWLGLEIAIQTYGLTNTVLRRGLGLWTYLLWAGSLIFALRALHNPKSDNAVSPTASLPPE